MTLFIPEWSRVPGRLLHVKRALAELDDEHVVRRPLRAPGAAVDFFVEHLAKGWLAVGIEAVPFEEIDPGQLFENEGRAHFEARLAELRGLCGASDEDRPAVGALLVLWACSTEEARQLTRAHLARFGVRLVSREQFERLGARLIEGSLAAVAEDIALRLRETFFPETEIPAACTTRRVFARDNRARLQRFFLDHDQEQAAKLDLELLGEPAALARDFSVRLVNGVAGSGKTLIALSRALLLAELYPREPVLMLIHNTPIVADLKDRLRRTRGRLPANLEISTYFGWAMQRWRALFGTVPAMADAGQVMNLARQARRAQAGLAIRDDRLVDELDFINDHLIRDEAAYLEADRTGRGFALRPKERAQVWAVREHVTRELRRSSLWMWSELSPGLCQAQEGREHPRVYRHVLVDEAQFFAPSWFHVVRQAVLREGQVFLCADPSQGFLKNRLSWKRVGIEVAGRTRRLRRSYRTTRAILEAATGLLEAFGAAEDEDCLRPDYAEMEAGVPPILVYTDTLQDAIERVVAEAVALAEEGGPALSSTLIVCGDSVPRSALHEQLARRLGHDAVWWFNAPGQKKAPPGIAGRDRLRMAYLDSATGLEAARVLLLGMERLCIDDDAGAPGQEEEARRVAREESARRLYMAMTRAGERLVLVSSRRLPAAIEGLFERRE